MRTTLLLAQYPAPRHSPAPSRQTAIRWPPPRAELTTQLIEAAKCSIGRHYGLAYTLEARHIWKNLDLWRQDLADIDCDIRRSFRRYRQSALVRQAQPRSRRQHPLRQPQVVEQPPIRPDRRRNHEGLGGCLGMRPCRSPLSALKSSPASSAADATLPRIRSSWSSRPCSPA